MNNINEKSILYIFNRAIQYDEEMKTKEIQSKEKRKETHNEKESTRVDATNTDSN